MFCRYKHGMCRYVYYSEVIDHAQERVLHRVAQDCPLRLKIPSGQLHRDPREGFRDNRDNDNYAN